MKTPCAGRSGFPQPLVRLGFPEGPRACSPLTAPSLAAALIVVICVVLTLKVTSLRDASVGWIVTLVLLLVALVIPIVVVWRQPQSNARLNFKVSATPSSSVFAPQPRRALARSGPRQRLPGLSAGQSLSRKGQRPETWLPKVQSPVWQCSPGYGGVGSPLAKSSLDPSKDS